MIQEGTHMQHIPASFAKVICLQTPISSSKKCPRKYIEIFWVGGSVTGKKRWIMWRLRETQLEFYWHHGWRDIRKISAVLLQAFIASQMRARRVYSWQKKQTKTLLTLWLSLGSREPPKSLSLHLSTECQAVQHKNQVQDLTSRWNIYTTRGTKFPM